MVFIVSQYFSELYVYNLDRFLLFFFVSNLRHKLLGSQRTEKVLRSLSVDVCARVLNQDFLKIFRVFTTLTIRNASE